MPRPTITDYRSAQNLKVPKGENNDRSIEMGIMKLNATLCDRDAVLKEQRRNIEILKKKITDVPILLDRIQLSCIYRVLKLIAESKVKDHVTKHHAGRLCKSEQKLL
jgi:hypothetical protein